MDEDNMNLKEPSLTKICGDINDYLRELADIKSEISSLKDLFVRRLNDDRQKKQLIDTLEAEARFAFVEPFLTDIILILDRLEQREDDFSKSIYEELYDILNRRGLERISINDEFDPILCKAVRSKENPNVDRTVITRICRNGYSHMGHVIRPVEVVVDIPVVD